MKTIKQTIAIQEGLIELSNKGIYEPAYKLLLEKDTNVRQREQLIEGLRKHNQTMNNSHISTIKYSYAKGRKDGFLNGVLIGELAVIGGYVLGRVIGYFITK